MTLSPCYPEDCYWAPFFIKQAICCRVSSVHLSVEQVRQHHEGADADAGGAEEDERLQDGHPGVRAQLPGGSY